MSELIAYKNVEIHQAEQIVLRDVNITVQSGEMIYLLGKVGSGKSTLMNLLVGERISITHRSGRSASIRI